MKSNVSDKKKKIKKKVIEPQSEEKQKRQAEVLSQKNKDETLTRFLFPKNPRAFKNLIEFSFANEEFTSVEQIDHTVFHLNLHTCIVRKDSDEGKKQTELIKKKIEKANSFVTLKDDDCIFYTPKNSFDHVDRHVQTFPLSHKDASTKTEPQGVDEICDTVCQSIIYDAYYEDFQKLTAEEEKKDKYSDSKSNDEHKGEDQGSQSGFTDDTIDSSKMATLLFSSITSSERNLDSDSDLFDTDEEKKGHLSEGSEQAEVNRKKDMKEVQVEVEVGEDVEVKIDENKKMGQKSEDSDRKKDTDKKEEDISGNDKEIKIHDHTGTDNNKKNEEMKKDGNTYIESTSTATGKEKREDDELGIKKTKDQTKEGKKSDLREEIKKEANEEKKTIKETEKEKSWSREKGKDGESTLQQDEKKKKKKKRIEEFQDEKRDMYYMNYTVIKEAEHKQLSFIYNDVRINKQDEKILYTESFLKTLKLMDNIYNKNNEEEIYLSYKNKNNKNVLTKLWEFLLDSYNLVITDIKFHPYYVDLFAISYKNKDHKKNFGILCCFTFKNTKHPEAFLKTNFHIHSLEWSSINHSIIVVGLSNGNICIYDLRKKKNERLIFQSNINEIYNRDIISQIKFHQPSKTFYSVSYDGNIFSWKYNNKFTTGEKILTLEKHMHDFTTNLNVIHTQSIICIDFDPFDKDLFLIGTDKGKIYLYSSSFSDQYIKFYEEHNMSVNAIHYNHFKKNMFISSSFDWSVRIWHQRRSKSLIVIDIKQCVYDVCWSPVLSTCFFVISGDSSGKIHIYDMSKDINEAVLVETITKKKRLRKLCLNKYNDVVLIGEENGHVHSYKITYNFNATYMDFVNGKIDDSFQIQLMNSFLRKVI